MRGASTVVAMSYISPRVKLSDVTASSMIGMSAGFDLR